MNITEESASLEDGQKTSRAPTYGLISLELSGLSGLSPARVMLLPVGFAGTR